MFVELMEPSPSRRHRECSARWSERGHCRFEFGHQPDDFSRNIPKIWGVRPAEDWRQRGTDAAPSRRASPEYHYRYRQRLELFRPYFLKIRFIRRTLAI
jgi:hypothetical protein